MKIPAIRCRKCGSIVFSRAEWDFRRCECGKVAIDGGFTVYGGRVIGDPEGYENLVLDLPVTKKELFDDWNERKDRFGIIRDKRENGKEENRDE